MSELDVHLSFMLLQTQVRMLLKPPRRDLSLTYPAEYRQRWRMVGWVVDPSFSKLSEVSS
jgi:hypothetical protein